MWALCVVQGVEHFLLEAVIRDTKMALNSDKQTVVVAMFLLLLAENVKASLTSDDKNTIFRALLIKPDVEKKTCPDITNLLHHFPKLMKDKQWVKLVINVMPVCCISCFSLLFLIILGCTEVTDSVIYRFNKSNFSPWSNTVTTEGLKTWTADQHWHEIWAQETV